MYQTAREIYHTEGGLPAFYRGLPAAVIRQAVYGGISIGLYRPVRSSVCGDQDPKDAPLWKRILSGGICGGIGQAIATPTDVVKVRLQADGRLALEGKPRRYKSTFDAFVKIPQQDGGIFGLYRGIAPSVQRAAIINGCGIATYDHSKQLTLRALNQPKDSIYVQILSSICSGFVSAAVSNPMDVVKTRIMNQNLATGITYTGTIDCFAQTISKEGVGALYKGFVPSYIRLAPWQCTFFVTYEALTKVIFGETL